MDFELKSTNPASVTTDSVADTTTVIQGFTTGVVGCPDSYKMVAGNTITVVVEASSTKTQAAIEAEVIAAVNTFITTNYPSV